MVDRKKTTFELQQTQPKTQKKIQPGLQYFAIDQPYDLTQSFKNLQNALKFIESPDIRRLQKNYFDLKSGLKKQQESHSQFSKVIYKKVISRDNDYKFQHKIQSSGRDAADQFNQRHLDSSGQGLKIQKKFGQNLQKRFRHGDHVSMQEKRQRLREEAEIPLNFKHVKAIETAQFQKLKDVQFYQLIRQEGEEKDFGHSTSTEFDNLNIQTYLENFKHSMVTQSQYHDKNSYHFMFNCNKELTFWRLQNLFKDDKKNEEEVLSNCAFFDSENINFFQVFDIAARNIELNDVIQFYQLKEQLKVKMSMERNNDSLEEKFSEAKKRFEEMKEVRLKSKNQRLPAKFVNSVAQTNDQMRERDFDQYFVQDAKNIFDRLSHLNEVRDRIVQEQQDETFGVMATNVGQEIGKELFKLLMLVLKDEKFINYSQFIKAQNQQDVQKKILELIYLQFKNFTCFEVNGVSKVQIIKKYLNERQKNERFFETFVFKQTKQKLSSNKPSARSGIKSQRS